MSVWCIFQACGAVAAPSSQDRAPRFRQHVPPRRRLQEPRKGSGPPAWRMDVAAASELEWQRKGRCAGVATKRAAGRCSMCWRPIGCVSCTWRRVHERAGARSSPARPAAAATARPAKTRGSGRPGSPALQRAEAVRPNLWDYWQVNNHCRTCNPGYYMHGHHCKARDVGLFDREVKQSNVP